MPKTSHNELAAETVEDFRKMIAEGREIIVDLNVMYQKLAILRAGLIEDFEHFNRAHRVSHDKKTSKRAALTLITNEPKGPAADPAA